VGRVQEGSALGLSLDSEAQEGDVVKMHHVGFHVTDELLVETANGVGLPKEIGRQRGRDPGGASHRMHLDASRVLGCCGRGEGPLQAVCSRGVLDVHLVAPGGEGLGEVLDMDGVSAKVVGRIE